MDAATLANIEVRETNPPDRPHFWVVRGREGHTYAADRTCSFRSMQEATQFAKVHGLRVQDSEKNQAKCYFIVGKHAGCQGHWQIEWDSESQQCIDCDAVVEGRHCCKKNDVVGMKVPPACRCRLPVYEDDDEDEDEDS